MSTFSKSVYLATPPSPFRPDKTWSKGPYRYFLDSKKRICKQVPIDLQLQLTSEPRYFKMQPEVVKQVVADTQATQRVMRAQRLRSVYASVRKQAVRYRVLGSMCAAVAVGAVVFAAYPWVPEVQYHLQQVVNPPAPQPAVNTVAFTQPAPTKQNRLVIPKVGVDTAVLEGPDLTVLDRAEGVWRQTGNLDKGNYVLAGHRFKYMPPNATTLYNLDKLEVGDVAMVDSDGVRRHYRVESKRVVEATEVSVLNQTPRQQLTIYTCNDVRETQRIVVVAIPVQAAQ